MHSAFEKFITNIRDLYSFEKMRKEKWAKKIAFLQKARLTCLYIYIYIPVCIYIYIYIVIFTLLKYDRIYFVLFLISHFSRH